MAPGLGLYLDEVFFEAYNTKQEAELLFESKQKSKKSSSASTSAKTEGDGEGGGEGEEKVSSIPSGPTSFQRVDVVWHDIPFTISLISSFLSFVLQTLGEVLKWSEEEDAKASMASFREGFIWPHIFREVSPLSHLCHVCVLLVACLWHAVQPL
jgi:hypothetical protein